MTIRRESSLTSDSGGSYPPSSFYVAEPSPSRQLPRGRPFTSPYVYDSNMRDYAYWDNMFYSRLVNGLTLHEFKKPPKLVLAVGEGTDLWVVNAAQAWPDTRFHCLDLSGATRNFSRMLSSLNILGQVTFEQSKLLDTTHYPDSYFDLVIVRHIAIHLSERDWPDTLAGLLRVTKQEGVVEFMLDDLLFPGSQIHESTYLVHPKSQARAPSPRPSASNASQPSIDDISALSLEHLSPISAISPRSDLPNARPRYDSLDSSYPPLTPTPLDAENPLDHSRLATAWAEMLAARDIPTSPTSVVPLYLSTVSTDFRLLPALQIPMPCIASSSPSVRRSEDEQTDVNTYAKKLKRKQSAAQRHGAHRSKDKTNGATQSEGSGNTPNTGMPHLLIESAPMHLARAMQTVRCCKEAIYEAYEVLYMPEVEIIAKKVPEGEMVKQKEEVSASERKASMRDRFEHDWRNWENDMQTRIRMRDTVNSVLDWPTPAPDLPAWRVWRDRLWVPDSCSSSGNNITRKEELCRTLRAFVLYKNKGPAESRKGG